MDILFSAAASATPFLIQAIKQGASDGANKNPTFKTIALTVTAVGTVGLAARSLYSWYCGPTPKELLLEDAPAPALPKPLEKREVAARPTPALSVLDSWLVKHDFDPKKDLNQEKKNGYTPLLLAIKEGDKDIIKALVKAGANPDFVSAKGWTPLKYAIFQEKTNIAKLLINEGADPNFIDNKGLTPLMWVISKRKAGRIQILVDAGADLNFVDKNGITPLRYAIAEGKVDMIQPLIDAGAQPDLVGNDGLTPLRYAIAEGKAQMVEALVAGGANPNLYDSKKWTPLQYAISKGKVDMIQPLIDAGAQPDLVDNDGLTPLRYAIAEGKAQMVEALVAGGANPNLYDSKNWTPLGWAILKEQNAIIELLITKLKVDPNLAVDGGFTPLEYAIITGKLAIVELLVTKLGADINCLNPSGWTPLRRALYQERKEITDWLLANGATPNPNDDLFVLYERLHTVAKLCAPDAQEKTDACLKRQGARFVQELGALNDLFALETLTTCPIHLWYNPSANALFDAWQCAAKLQWHSDILKNALTEQFNQVKISHTFFVNGEWEDLSKHVQEGKPYILKASCAKIEKNDDEESAHAVIFVGDGDNLGFGNTGWELKKFDEEKKLWTADATDKTYEQARRTSGVIFTKITAENKSFLSAQNLKQINAEVGLTVKEVNPEGKEVKLASLKDLDFAHPTLKDLKMKDQKRGNCGSKGAKIGKRAHTHLVVEKIKDSIADPKERPYWDQRDHSVYKDLTLLHRGLKLAKFAIAADEDFVESSLPSPSKLIDEAFTELVRFATARTKNGHGEFNNFTGNVFTQMLKMLEGKTDPCSQHLRSKIQAHQIA